MDTQPTQPRITELPVRIRWVLNVVTQQFTREHLASTTGMGVGVSLLGGLALLASAGLLYQGLAMRRDARRYPPLGRFVDVHGRKMHLICMGQGQPAVVLDSGLSGSALDWSRVQPVVASFTQACAYDRAGCGWSDPGPRPRTSQQIADDLHALLQAAGIEPPYVLVGHSSGGLNVRVYAHCYPDEVAGLVLVDAAHEGQRERLPRRPLVARLIDEARWRWMYLYPLGARLGLMRLLKRPNGVIDALPQEVQLRATSVGIRSRAYDWIVTEAAAIRESEEQARRAGSVGALPLVVVSAHVHGAPPGLSISQADHLWQEMQEELATLSTQSTRIVAEESGHFIHLDQPNLVVEAVRSLVETVRHAWDGGVDGTR
jgi:pimeloyl-ACP methyl ester carboxylesterase